MAKFRHHKYTWSKPFGSVSHNWELVGPQGAVSFHATLTTGYDTSSGLEFHHTPLAGYRCDEAPDHIDCKLTGGPCWHDGTSLYAMETLWPMIASWLRSGDHDTVFRCLEDEYTRHFAQFTPAPSHGLSKGGTP